MLRSLIGTLLVSLANLSFANNIALDKRLYRHSDTIPVSMYAGAKKTDSNILVVLDGKVLGTIREIKSFDAVIKAGSIRSINVLKDTVATNRYGEKGKSGVIEIASKNEKSQPEDIYVEERSDDDDMIFTKAEVEASYPGGEAGWKMFLEKNLNPIIPIENGAPVGIYKVIVQFVVDRNGIVSDIRALTSFGYGMEIEVKRIFKKSPNWQPAMQNGRTVKAYRIQPVIFVVDAEDINVEMKEKYILYAGVENPVKINVDKVESEDLLIIPSQGTVLPAGNGNFKIKVNNPGKLIIDIYNKKKNKPLGSVYFIVQSKL